ncbi:MAG: hypothetical protein QOF76_69 [Solirubrobacteraceae bacterium]|jgi:hypothetical protein|nr:hypothetical protein [Solirubrobacteraceae bacterium]
MPLHYSDDASVHEKTDAFDWRESWYCNFFDTESRFFGTAWHGVRPNQERGESVFVLFENGQPPLIYDVDTHMKVDKDVGEERLSAGHHRFECVEPWSHWKVHYDNGTAKATVDWKQFSEVCDWEEREAVVSDGKEFLAAAKHYEAAGAVTVNAEVDGRKIEFAGFGERDRAWGVRNYGPLSYSWWHVAQFPDGDAMHAWAMVTPDGEMRLYGFLHRDGVSRPTVKFTCEVEYDGEDGPPIKSSWHLIDDQGRELICTEMTMMQELAFRTEADGAALETGRAHPEQKTGLWYWTWQRCVRDDGVIGHGMVDLNLWRGENRSSFEATGPCGALYTYGLETSSSAA